tara:strand:+ start:1395 stop:2594 length:1200 start_codon:yes stop_codon:yes gene_type:complete
MGVSGLLPFVESATQECHVSQFGSVAVDASCWLHRGARAGVPDMLHGRDPTKRSLGFSLRMIDMLLKSGVRPIVVFDGAPLPMKARTDAARRVERQRHREAAQALMLDGKAALAEKELAGAIEVTARMRELLIDALRERDVSFVVAPYEADAQLAFLVLSGACEAAITEDSDLLAYRCPRTIFKLKDDGYGRLQCYDDLQLACEAGGARLFDGQWADEWRQWESGLFTDLCILAGCDFLEMPGVGVKTAHKLLREHRSIQNALTAMLRAGQLTDHALAEAYLEQFWKVQLVFRHQRVYNPETRAMQPLRTDDENYITSVEHFDYLGMPLLPRTAQMVCERAVLCPRTLQPVEGVDPSQLKSNDATPEKENRTPSCAAAPEPHTLGATRVSEGSVSRFFR